MNDIVLNHQNNNNDYSKYIVQNEYTFERIKEIANFVRTKLPVVPNIGIICGSGLGALADNINNTVIIPYENIPHFPRSTVQGHKGQFVFGYLSKIPVLCMQGRFHYYEGYPLWMCVIPIRVMNLMKITHVILSNAAGGLNPNFEVGDIMLINDHVNIMGLSGINPLVGFNDERFGPRFVSMHESYSQEIIEKAKEIAKEENFIQYIKEGVYTCVGGPSFETPAELRVLKGFGIDAVGMSTVHEVVAAKQSNMIVFAFSLITNKCVTNVKNHSEVDHEDVLKIGNLRSGIITSLISKIVIYIENQLIKEYNTTTK